MVAELQETGSVIAKRHPQPAPAVSGDHVSLKSWIAVIGAALGAFMAVLDIQIVNASLRDIQGAIGAGIDDGGWISTSYLVAEIIVIPLTGWLSRAFSVRRYVLVNATLFTAFSVACAFSQTLGQMIVLRAAQGFTGGILIPMAFTIIITMLPKAKQPIGLAMFAISATFAPAIGPTIGGYLTENWSWEFIFYVNLVPGLIMVVMLWFSLESSPMQLSLLRQGDWLGIVTMAIGFGTLQTFLEEGNKDDWFGSPFITRLAVISAISLSFFFWIELTVKKPLLNLRLLQRRNFGFGSLANFLMGFALYGSVYILPVYLSSIQGYNSEQIGMVLAWTGLPQLVLIPFVPKLMKRFDARLVIAVGFSLFAASNFFNIYMTIDYSGQQLILPNIIRAVGQALAFAPLSAVTTAGIEKENAGSASALFNMMRNLGGAIGIAVLQTFLTKREQFHSNVLTEAVSLTKQATNERLQELTNYFLTHGASSQAEAWRQAVIAIGKVVRQQSYVLAFSDTFFLLGIGLGIALVASLLLKKPGNLQGGGGAH